MESPGNVLRPAISLTRRTGSFGLMAMLFLIGAEQMSTGLSAPGDAMTAVTLLLSIRHMPDERIIRPHALSAGDASRVARFIILYALRATHAMKIGRVGSRCPGGHARRPSLRRFQPPTMRTQSVRLATLFWRVAMFWRLAIAGGW
jgi:hypothetical protein